MPVLTLRTCLHMSTYKSMHMQMLGHYLVCMVPFIGAVCSVLIIAVFFIKVFPVAVKR